MLHNWDVSETRGKRQQNDVKGLAHPIQGLLKSVENGPSESARFETGVEQGEKQQESKMQANIACGRNSPKHKDQKRCKDWED